MKILLTGSKGFIGQELLQRSNSLGEIFELTSDLRDHKSVRQEVLAVNPHIIIHLAARTEVEASFYEQITFSEINYVGSVNLIECAKECSNLKLLLVASTMETYGWQPVSTEVRTFQRLVDPKSYAFDESTPLNPNAPYAVAKVGVEKYLEYANRCYGLKYISLRQTNTYGRTKSNFFVTESIISQMVNSNNISLGYKLPYRNFIYIDDLLELYEIVIKEYKNIPSGHYCIGPNNPIQIQDYAKLIAKKIKWNGAVNWETRPERVGEIYYLSSKNDLISNYTGWYPKTTLEEGLERTIKVWKNM